MGNKLNLTLAEYQHNKQSPCGEQWSVLLIAAVIFIRQLSKVMLKMVTAIVFRAVSVFN